MMLQADGLALERGQRQLFSDLNLCVRSGQALRVVGPNGAGKTSLLRVLSGLLPPSAGCVQWRGKPLSSDRSRLHGELLYAGHQSGIKDDLSAIENVRFGAALRGRRCNESQARAALSEAGLGGRVRQAAGLLSQGQRRRVLLAQLLVQPVPALAVLDEPFNALDQGAVQWLTGVLHDLLDAGGVVVYTTHQNATLRAGAEQSLVLRGGT
ncbi:cytochrome c biogenesis heme-transporting ATPase CcmA [Aquabacterium sp.]|uniref:cytochrome c biogenesis heme-transporting ATPase CcmA n=1 Tax=Aquabacterium sp. TaxID=1872578 RepID=UPI0035AF5D7D